MGPETLQANDNKTTQMSDMVVTTTFDYPSSLALDTLSSSRHGLGGCSHMDFHSAFDTNVCIHVFKEKNQKMAPMSSLIDKKL
jgi:hypothetical protein